MRRFQGDGGGHRQGALTLCFLRTFRGSMLLFVEQMGFKLFLGISPTLTNFSADGKEFSIMLDDPASGVSNPLAEFVELPDDAREGLWYSNLLCGVIRGACEMVGSDLRPETTTSSSQAVEFLRNCH